MPRFIKFKKIIVYIEIFPLSVVLKLERLCDPSYSENRFYCFLDFTFNQIEKKEKIFCDEFKP